MCNLNEKRCKRKNNIKKPLKSLAGSTNNNFNYFKKQKMSLGPPSKPTKAKSTKSKLTKTKESKNNSDLSANVDNNDSRTNDDANVNTETSVDAGKVNSPLKKRGRKSKKETQSALEENNIVVMIEEKDDHENEAINDPENVIMVMSTSIEEENICKPSILTDEKLVVKKRGRKPKGGKIIQQIVPVVTSKEPKPNVILHLKCSIKDLQNVNLFGSSIEGFSFSNGFGEMAVANTGSNHFIASTEASDTNEMEEDDYRPNGDIRDIWRKLKVLEHNLHVNHTNNKKSACFWDTCEFDNPPVFIPKHYMNETYQVYGCFCSPECAVAHLMEENIDSSVKFERYQQINHIYSKVYNYDKNIKPAPNPYYMLDKYFGNLSIQEYRSLLRNERLFLVVDKPLTRVMPELHEDNDDFIINNKIIPSNTYQLKKRMQKKQTKTNILSERFGLAQN